MTHPKAITEPRLSRWRFLKQSGPAGLGLASLAGLRLTALWVCAPEVPATEAHAPD